MISSEFLDFFKNDYTKIKDFEVIEHDVSVAVGVVCILANRSNQLRPWHVTVELFIKNHHDRSANFKEIGFKSDEELLCFVKEFNADKYEDYFN